MAIVLVLDGGNIIEAKYSTYGCVSSEMCGQWLCEAVEEISTDNAMLITEASIVDAIGAMPLGREHCPGLAIAALRHALDQC